MKYMGRINVGWQDTKYQCANIILQKVKRANFMLIKISFLHPSCTPFIFSLDPTFLAIFPFSQLLLPSSFYPHNNNCFFHPHSILTTTTASSILVLPSPQQLLLTSSQMLFPTSFYPHNNNCFFHSHKCFFLPHSSFTTSSSIFIPS